MAEACSTSAAVMLLERIRGEAEILLTLRSANLRQHRGEIAFPGGKCDPGDVDLSHTAVRETCEELGVSWQQVTVRGRLPESYTGRGVRVQPFIGSLLEDAVLTPNPAEVAAAFWVPMSQLLQDQRVRTDVFSVGGREYWAPAWRYKEYLIWGFTARVLVTYLNRYWDAGIARGHPAPVVRFKPAL